MTTPANAIYVNEGDVVYSSRTTGEAAAAVGQRPIDEVEGSLLPVATQLNDDNSGGDDVHVQVFDYDAEVVVEQADQQQEEHRRSAELQLQEERPLIAHHIPSGNENNLHNPDSIADDSRNTVKYAERTGIQHAEEEKDAICKANRKVFAHNYFEEQQFQVANARAKRRDGEGLQVVSPVETPSATETRAGEKKQDSISNTQNDGNGSGYRVQEYNIADTYETGRYDVKEYKSVYD
ncbi:MAG: hypothetical protein SGILL_010505 [Bacillariaceae sp.]